MKIKLVMVCILIISLFLISCTKNQSYTISEINGVRIYKNTGLPTVSVKDLNISIKKELEIDGNIDSLSSFYQPKYLVADKSGKIFIYDEQEISILMFSKNGDFLSRTGRQGQGPGEFMHVIGMTIKNDTVYLLDPNPNKLHLLSTTNTYLRSKSIGFPRGLYQNFSAIDEGFLTGRLGLRRSDTETYLSKSISQIPEDVQSISNFEFTEIPYSDFDKNIFSEHERSQIFTFNNSLVYIANSGSKEKYEIRCYNHERKLIQKIIMKSPLIRISDTEKESELRYLNQFFYQNKADNKTKGRLKAYLDFKYQLKNLFCDNKGRLWVLKNVPEKEYREGYLYFDIFENGIFQNSINYNFNLTAYQHFYDLPQDNIKFINDKIYVLDKEKCKVIVYSY